MTNRNESSSSDVRPQVSRRRTTTTVALLVMGATLLMLASGAMAQSQEEPPEIPSGVPEHYPALRIYVEGEILEVLSGGLALRLLTPPRGGQLFGDDRSDPRDPLPPIAGLESRDQLIVNLKNAKGWLFIDDPDGGPQERVRMDRGREIFAPGQMVEIGPAPGFESSATEGSISNRSTRAGQGTSIRMVPFTSVRGWVYIRINRFKEQNQ